MPSEQIVTVDSIGLVGKQSGVAHSIRRVLASAHVDHLAAVEHTLRRLHEALGLVRVPERMLALFDAEDWLATRPGELHGLGGLADVIENRPHLRVRNRAQTSRARHFSCCNETQASKIFISIDSPTVIILK
jgi:hypothetical protein